VRQTTLVCSLGKELAKDRVTSLAKRALVGRFFYLKMQNTRLDRWVQDCWKPILGYCPRINHLSNHWLIFHFLSEDDLQQILSTPWILDRGVLMLKRWTPGFHPFKSTFDKRWLWMIMPDFPIELWTSPILEMVANTAGKFIFFDQRSLNWSNKRAAWVLVEFDTDLGLPDSIEIRVGEHSFRQILDYWREPFRCHLCWQPGHLKSNCSSSKDTHPAPL
jgi:hypothetical protein